MPHRALARRPAALVVSLAVGGLLVTGCGRDAATQADAPKSSASTPAASTTGSAPSTTPSTTPSATATASPTLASPGPLLSAAELPGFTSAYHWRAGSTTPREPSTAFGTCQRFGLLSIGAERVVVRRYRPPADPTAGGDRAGELVATFPDAMTARRAYAVLGSWQARCADRLRGYRHSDVGRIQDVPVGSGQAGWYLLTYGPVEGQPDDRFFDAQGTALVGSRIAMVSLQLVGQDYTYPGGREPMVAAVQRAAQKLA
jgi:hypothetical protein